jgi:integrase
MAIINNKTIGLLGDGEHRDDDCPGLIFRVYKGGQSWNLRFTRKSDSSRHRWPIGTFPEIGIAKARIEANALKARIATGWCPREAEAADEAAKAALEVSASAKAERDRLTFRVLADEFLAKATHLRPATLLSYRHGLDQACRQIGDVPARELTQEQVEAVRDLIAERGSLVSADRVRAAIGAVYKWATDQRATKGIKSPARGVKSVAKSKPRRRKWTDAEIIAIWNALDAERTLHVVTRGAPPVSQLSPNTVDAIRLCLLSGGRRAESAGARLSEFSDLEGDKPLWTLPGDDVHKGRTIPGRTKNHREKIVPLSPAMVALVKRARARNPGSPFLFPGASGAGHMTEAGTTRALARMRDALRKAHIKANGGSVPEGDTFMVNMNLHDLRTTCRTWMRAARISEDVRDHVLGHAGDTIGERVYEADDPIFIEEHVRPAMKAWAAHIENLTSGVPSNVVQMQRKA